ncbi:MAG TPA: TonB-dependent receptor [Vicinamibacteria bacterium]|jgi:hypothetical protein|nr:TonB-dependent receptor [Vicinamibacteria bacterium]
MVPPRALLVSLFVLLGPGRLCAQAGLEVTVYQRGTQAPIPGVEVLVLNPQTNFRSLEVTNDQGKAHFAALSTAGTYDVGVAEGQAFYAVTARGLTLRSNFDRSVTLTLIPRAQAKEAVTVTAETSIAQVNATSAEVSSTLAADELALLPVEGRDITRSLYRLPNVTPATGFYPEAPNVSINGANSLYSNYMIDGLDNNENFLGGQKFALPLGFTQEITVLTSNYGAEFGRTGNGIFNITSRSGGNALTGEVFYLMRPGPALDAHSPFPQHDLSGNPVKDGFQRNQGGFGLGGPLVRDRTFFYLDAEYTRDVKDNLLRSPELGVDQTVTGHNGFLYLSGKLDHRLSQDWTASLRVNEGRVTIESPGGGLDGGVTFPSAGSSQDRDSTLVAARAFHVGRELVFESALQYSRFRWNYGRAPDRPQTVVLGAQGQTIAVLGNPGFVFDDVENTLQIQEKVTRHAGRHTLRLGTDLLGAQFALTGGGNVHGNYLVQLTQAQQDALRARGLGAGLRPEDIPADAQVLDYSVELRPTDFGRRQNLVALYAEDLFAVTSRLNLTLGLRYDYDSLSKGGGKAGDTDNLAPRLGVNYQLSDGSTLRGGYGVFYDKIVYSIVSDALQQNSTAPGFRGQLQGLIALGLLPPDTDLDRITFDGNLSADYENVPYLGGPTPAQAQAQRGLVVSNERRILNPLGYPNPRAQQFALGYQRQMGERHLFYVDLIHARGEGLPRLRDLNAPAPYPIDPANVVVRTEAQANATRPVGVAPGGARSIIVTETAGKSRYYAASVNLVKARGRDPFAYRLSYTLSSLKNDTEDINFRAQDANDFALEYGPSINDRRHVVSAILWAYPVGGVGLSLAGLLQSGQPINRIPDARLYGTTDLNGDGRSFADAYDGNSDRWPGAPRNGDRLPWAYTFDLGVQGTIKVGQRRLELRADVFNLFNHINLSGFSNNATQSNQIQVGPPGAMIVEKNSAPPRQFQFGLRYAF